MGPAEEYEDGPPEELEDGEVRGPMSGYPREEDVRARPLTQRLLEGLRRRRDTVIQVYPRAGVEWRGGQVLRRGLQLAAGLRALGVCPGDRVSLVCACHPEYGPLYLATLLAGAAWAPLNDAFDARDLRLLLALMEPRVVVAEAAVARRLAPLVAELQAEGRLAGSVLVTLGEGDAWDVLAAPRDDSSDEDLERLLPPPPADPKGAVAVIACSSGTSGLPKGVTTSHFAMLCGLHVLSHPDALPGMDSRLLLTSPGFWVTGILFTLLSMAHDTIVIYDYGCTEEELLDSIERHRPPLLFTANNFLLSVAKVHETSQPQKDVSSLRLLLTGGAAMSAQAEQFVATVMGCPVHNVYGMTELNGGIGLGRREHYKAGSVGQLSPFMRCKVVDPSTGKALGPHQEGELRFKGVTLTSGYFKNTKASAELFDAVGWLRSGDLGLYDDEGYFWVTGRIKDTIKYRGVHVSPVDVEGVLDAHDAVHESAVVGVPDELQGELPRAYVVLRPDAAVSADELCRLVQATLAPHKWLRGGVVFLPALPKTSTGKISRNDIRKQYVLPQVAGST